jgi:group I intron endonuclease
MTGIYIIKNIINNKIYIGSSKNIENRFRKHLSALKGGRHINKHLQAAFIKYGEENFSFNILKETSILILRKAEQLFINKHQSLNPKYGYNKAVVESNKWDDFEKEDVSAVKERIYFGCYTKEGKLKKVFRTIKEVYIYLGKRDTRIYDACNSNLRKTSKNLYWIRINVDLQKFPKTITPKTRMGRHRKLYQYDFNNNLINTWESAVIAGKSLNINSNEITRCLKKDNIYKNSKWFYSPIIQ